MNSNFALNLYTALCKQSKQWKLDDWHDANPENCYLQGLLSVVENLPESDRKVLAALYQDNLTLAAAGKIFGYSSGSHIGTLRNKIFRKLRHPKRMEDYNTPSSESRQNHMRLYTCHKRHPFHLSSSFPLRRLRCRIAELIYFNPSTKCECDAAN